MLDLNVIKYIYVPATKEYLNKFTQTLDYIVINADVQGVESRSYLKATEPNLIKQIMNLIHLI